MQLPLPPFGRYSSLAALLLFAGCAASKPAKVSWTGVPNFEAPLLEGKKFAVDFKQPAAAPEFDFIPAHLRTIGTDRGMVFTKNSHEADFVICAAVRYFDASPVADGGSTVLAADKKIEAGIATWIAGDAAGANGLRKNIAPIDPKTLDSEVPAPRSSNEWVVVIDIAVGELTKPSQPVAEASSSQRFVRYETRLYGHVERHGMSRKQAAIELAEHIKANIGGALPFVVQDEAPIATSGASNESAPPTRE